MRTLMPSRFLLSLLFIVILHLSQQSVAQIPRTLSYQGVLTDTAGTPKPDGTYNFTFRLYAVASGGTAIWSETKSAQVTRGLFSTILGSITSFPDSVRFDRQYWLGTQVAASPELSPRIQLTTVGSSFSSLRADVAQTVPDNSITAGKIAGGEVVKSINALKDNVTLAGGSNVTITPSGNTLTIAASGGGTNSWAANGNDITNTNSGGVGIGAAPLAGYKLDVNGAARMTPGGSGGAINFSTPNAETGMTIVGTNRADIRFDGNLLKLLTATGTGVPASTSGIVITTNGDVGIGSTAPGAKLRVQNDFPNGGGVYAFTTDGIGMHGQSNNSGVGVEGIADVPSGIGVSYGVFGSCSAGYGVYSSGNTGASGTKSFRIDHPNDPTGKYLLHYAAESPDVLNMYTGNAVTDADGYATITLPDYFDEINRDPRYTLTVINEGGTDFVQAMIVQKIRDNRFVIRTSKPAIEVSWEVKALRNDLWVRTHGAPVEAEKQGRERGKYQHPELYGMPNEMGMNYRPEMERGKTTPPGKEKQ
ncbi:MAG: hypothetical protein HY961_15090 [Ignavibacteriae bacterium]|nr:hypothetical protein [Ignavibacteriota bacterium]